MTPEKETILKDFAQYLKESDLWLSGKSFLLNRFLVRTMESITDQVEPKEKEIFDGIAKLARADKVDWEEAEELFLETVRTQHEKQIYGVCVWLQALCLNELNQPV